MELRRVFKTRVFSSDPPPCQSCEYIRTSGANTADLAALDLELNALRDFDRAGSLKQTHFVCFMFSTVATDAL